MYNQAQGVYPQVAGSFYNVGGMSPHDNGRVASQIPTFSGAFPGLIGAEYALNNFGGLTMGQSPMQYRAAAMEQQMASRASIVGGLGMGIGLLGGLASFTNPVGLAAMAAGSAMHGYRERIDEVLGLRNALKTSVFNTRMVDPFTGTLKLTTANQLTDSMRNAGHQLGMSHGDLNQVLTTAGSSGLLANSSSVADITKRVMDLAKMSKEIMQLGEGITAADAMELQKLMNDMGVSGGKFKTMGIGKNLVTAARATGMSLEAALQISGQGASTYQQLGLGAAAGLNAGSFSLMTANALSRSSNMDPTMLRKLGGAEGLQQALLGGTASTMARFSDAMMLGALKLDPTGAMSVDFDLVDRFAKGHISTADLVRRGKSLTANMSTGQKNRFMEQLSYSMSDLKAQMSDMVNPEQTMAIQGRQILELANKSGISVKQAAHSYFQDAQQAEAFLAYASDFKGVRQAGADQRMITHGDDILRLAAKAKQTDALSLAGRGVVGAVNTLGDMFGAVYDSTLGYVTKNLADTSLRSLESEKRGMRLLGSGYLTGGVDPDTVSEARGLGFGFGDLYTARPRTGLVSSGFLGPGSPEPMDRLGRLELLLKDRDARVPGEKPLQRMLRDASNTNKILGELGIEEDDIITFIGTDINQKVNQVMEGHSIVNDVGEFITSLMPFEGPAKVRRVTENIVNIHKAVKLNRGAIGYKNRAGLFDQKQIEKAAEELAAAYKDTGYGAKSAYQLQTLDLGGKTEEEKAKLRYLADQYNLEQGGYTADAKARRAQVQAEIAEVLGLSPADVAGEFTEDQLVFREGTITGKGLDSALVRAKRAGISDKDLKNIINRASRGVSDNVALGGFRGNAAAVELLRVLKGSKVLHKDIQGKDRTSDLVRFNEGGFGFSVTSDPGGKTEFEKRFDELAREERTAYEQSLSKLFAEGRGNGVLNNLVTLGNDSVSSDFRKDVEGMLKERGMDTRSANYNAIVDYAGQLQRDIDLSDNKQSATNEARTKLLMKLNDLAQGTGTNPGAGQGSADLPSVMSQIRDGLTNFNTAMQQIASAAAGSENRVVTVELKPAAK